MIGVCRNCDAALDFSWEEKLEVVNILASRFVSINNKQFLNKLLKHKNDIMIVVICSGMYNTPFENNTPSLRDVKSGIAYLISNGFRTDRIVLGVHPVFYNTKGIIILENVLNYFKDSGVYKVRLLKLNLNEQIKRNFITKFNKIPKENQKLRYYGFYSIIVCDDIKNFININKNDLLSFGVNDNSNFYRKELLCEKKRECCYCCVYCHCHY